MQRLVFVAVLLAATRAGAPPPISSFPALILPSDGSDPPRNTRYWAFGRDAPPLSSIGVALSVNGSPLVLDVVALGCCLVQGRLTEPLAAADTGLFTVSSAGSELTSAFVVYDHIDVQPPGLADVSVLDFAQGRLVIGVQGNDDHEVAGYLARAPGADEIVGATPYGYVLEAPASSGACVDVSAVDLSGNESNRVPACAPAEGEGEGEGDGGGGCACSHSTLTPGALALVALYRRRSRRSPP
ncbi:MAG: hypothetical protein IT383_16775 [Deltaproteobacteria bacterium]|nr:hypothetical protein [Deltaproteobacteria bacterium]